MAEIQLKLRKENVALGTIPGEDRQIGPGANLEKLVSLKIMWKFL